MKLINRKSDTKISDSGEIATGQPQEMPTEVTQMHKKEKKRRQHETKTDRELEREKRRERTKLERTNATR